MVNGRWYGGDGVLREIENTEMSEDIEEKHREVFELICGDI
jgi:hypothetical protein